MEKNAFLTYCMVAYEIEKCKKSHATRFLNIYSDQEVHPLYRLYLDEFVELFIMQFL